MRLGRPRLAYLITAGNLDSMVNHYTVAKHRRSSDVYAPGGKTGLRPDRATIVYSKLARRAYPGVPVIIGGLEASLRRFAHYDYWDNSVRRSVLADSGADILIYGMGEHPIVELADALESGLAAEHITYVRGTGYMARSLDKVYDYKEIASFEQVAKDKCAYAEAFMEQQTEYDVIRGKTLVQKHGDMYLVMNPPAELLTAGELDDVYALPYMRAQHPSYQEKIPAFDEVEFSLTSVRGCFGGCSFCALTYHQGRVIQARSHESLLSEARLLTAQPNFKGYIHDVGGPTANFRQPSCKKQLKTGVCADRQCLWPKKCANLTVSHSDYTALLTRLRQLPKVKKVFVRSGIRYDYIVYDDDQTFLNELVEHHISGQLKVAPEHINEDVLYMMGKPSAEIFERFIQKYEACNRKHQKEQYLTSYFMSSHPGSDLNAAIELAQYLKRTGRRVEQVQDFYPTPGTLSTCMYYTGLDPRTMKPVYIPKGREKELQRALLQFDRKQNFALVREALRKAERDDLIGSGKNCLVPAEIVYDHKKQHQRRH
jgi:uncharacterized radical SAM protein YgiQ